MLHSTPTQCHTRNSHPLNIGGLHLTSVSTYKYIHKIQQQPRDISSYVFPDGMSHYLKPQSMRDGQESIWQQSPRFNRINTISQLTTHTCTCLPHDIGFLMKTKMDFRYHADICFVCFRRSHLNGSVFLFVQKKKRRKKERKIDIHRAEKNTILQIHRAHTEGGETIKEEKKI